MWVALKVAAKIQSQSAADDAGDKVTETANDTGNLYVYTDFVGDTIAMWTPLGFSITPDTSAPSEFGEPVYASKSDLIDHLSSQMSSLSSIDDFQTMLQFGSGFGALGAVFGSLTGIFGIILSGASTALNFYALAAIPMILLATLGGLSIVFAFETGPIISGLQSVILSVSSITNWLLYPILTTLLIFWQAGYGIYVSFLRVTVYGANIPWRTLFECTLDFGLDILTQASNVFAQFGYMLAFFVSNNPLFIEIPALTFFESVWGLVATVWAFPVLCSCLTLQYIVGGFGLVFANPSIAMASNNLVNFAWSIPTVFLIRPILTSTIPSIERPYELQTGTLNEFFGSLIGVVSGYFGGIVESLTGWLVDVQLSFPFLLLAIFLLGALGGGTLAVILILALATWVNYARIVRAQVLSIKNQGYVEAAHATGASVGRVLFVHILPNTLAPICVVASFSMAQAILTEAGLSFLGVGLDPSTPSWGTMLNDGRDYLLTAWWISTMPGIAIGFTVLGVMLFGEGLRELLDPRGMR